MLIERLALNNGGYKIADLIIKIKIATLNFTFFKSE